MNELKIGVVGLGLGKHFVAACANSNLVQRLVVCDPNKELLATVQATQKRIQATYTDIDEMLSSEKLDAVCVVTPDQLHRPHVETCLNSGCHVLMTKPLATTLEDGRAIIAAADRSGRKVMVAHERRFRSRFKKIKELLSNGRLGEIIFLQLNQLSDRREQFAKAPWYASQEAGRSAIIGSGIHEVDLLRFLINQPIETISACGNRLGELAFPKNKTTATLFGFQGGAVGQTAISYEAHWPKNGQPENHLMLIATKGVILGRKVKTDDCEDWEDLPVDPIEIAVGCAGSVDAFLDAIVHDKPVPITTRDGYATLAACVAADESAATGKTVKPDMGA